MAKHFRVSPKFHLWARRRGLSDAETRLAFYLLTCEHRNLEGLYLLPKPYISADLGWTLKKVEDALTVVVASGLVLYDESAEVVLIPKALKHQHPSTPNQITGAVNQLRRIPKTSLWDAFLVACKEHCPRLADAIGVEWPSHDRRMTVASPPHDDAIPARSRADARAGTSSISNSISRPPLAPPADAGGEPDTHEQSSTIRRKNSRAHGTNPRALEDAEMEQRAAAARRAAVDALRPLSEVDGKRAERFSNEMRGRVNDTTWDMWLCQLRPVGISDGVLVFDGPNDVRSWFKTRFETLFAGCAELTGVPTRLATEDEHRGLEAA